MDLGHKALWATFRVLILRATNALAQLLVREGPNGRACRRVCAADESDILEAFAADEERRVGCDDHLCVPARQLSQDVREVSRLRWMLIQLWLFAPEKQRGRAVRLAISNLLKESEKVRPLQAVPHSR